MKGISELTARIITATIGVAAILFLSFYSPTVGIPLFITLNIGVASLEYTAMSLDDDGFLPKALSFAGSTSIGLTSFFIPSLLFPISVASLVFVYLIFLFFHRDKDRSANRINSIITGVVYGTFPLTCLGLLVLLAGETGPYWLILTLTVVWFSDTGAYFGGKSLGEHPLYEQVSPNKSIEGSIFGLLGSLVGGFACNVIFVSISSTWPGLSIVELLALVIPANILAQLGDLSESLIKRSHGVKDSGNILWGHGGLLDRIDGLIFAAPWFYFYFLWSNGEWFVS